MQQGLYGTLYSDFYNRALKERELTQRMQDQRAEQLLRNMQMQKLMHDMAQQGQVDEETNRMVNTLHPPMAEAVPPDPNNPDDVAWARQANGMANRYQQEHPYGTPGGAQPFTGGAATLSKMRGAILPQEDAIAKRMEETRAAREAARQSALTLKQRTQLENEVGTMRRNLSRYIPGDLDAVTGLDSIDPTTGAHNDTGTGLAVAAGSARNTLTPDFSNPGTNPIRSVGSIQEQYRAYKAKAAALKALQSQPAGPIPPVVAPPMSTGPQIPAGRPPAMGDVPAGARVRQGDKTYEKQADGTFAEVL